MKSRIRKNQFTEIPLGSFPSEMEDTAQTAAPELQQVLAQQRLRAELARKSAREAQLLLDAQKSSEAERQQNLRREQEILAREQAALNGQKASAPAAAAAPQPPRISQPVLPTPAPLPPMSPTPSLAAPEDQDPPIGRILVEARRMKAGDVSRVLEAANRGAMRFGDAAVRMGLVRPEDVEYALARQFAFPYVARGDTRLSDDLLAVFSPNHPSVVQLRALRSQISLRTAGNARGVPVVAIVSPNRGDGRSFVAANLAVVFAQLGQQTLLIDASMRNPVIHRYFRLDQRRGLSTSLVRPGRGAARAIEAIPGLQVMPAGPPPPNPLELIEKPGFQHLVDHAARRFDVVIIDTPAGSEGTDALLIANRAGAAIVVANAAGTREPEAREFAVALEQARTHVLGLVFNEHP